MTKTRKELFEMLRSKGWTLQRIGDKYGISRERVRQILLGNIYRPDSLRLEPFERDCDACSKVFTATKRAQKYCPECAPIMNFLSGRDRTRERVRIRDNRTCQECGKVWESNMRRFDIHHIGRLCGKLSKSYDGIDNIDKLTTLCHKCHIGNHASEKIRAAAKRMTTDKMEAAEVLLDYGLSQDKVAKLLNLTQVNISKKLRR